MIEESRPQVFISYSRRDTDEEWLSQFVDHLRKMGVKAWFDESMQVGDSLSESIENALRTSQLFVFLLSRSLDPRPNELFEFGAARGMGKPVVLIAPAGLDREKLPAPFRSQHLVDQESPEEAAELVVAAAGAA